MDVHTNLRLIYRKRQEWLKGRTKMWDVFPDDMGLDNNMELALANMDLTDPVLEPVTFDDEPTKGSSSTPGDITSDLGLRLGIEENEEEDKGGSSDSGVEFDMEEQEDY